MQRQIIILTGDFDSGKTTTCRQLADWARSHGLDCAGIICPARFAGGQKVGIDLLNVRTKQQRPLAEVDERPAALRTGKYRFDTETMEWGKRCLDEACPCDVLFVDELGPLELERGQGWTNALDILRTGTFRLAIPVVRPRLIEVFRAAIGNIPVEVVSLPATGIDRLYQVPDPRG